MPERCQEVVVSTARPARPAGVRRCGTRGGAARARRGPPAVIDRRHASCLQSARASETCCAAGRHPRASAGCEDWLSEDRNFSDSDNDGEYSQEPRVRARAPPGVGAAHRESRAYARVALLSGRPPHMRVAHHASGSLRPRPQGPSFWQRPTLLSIASALSAFAHSPHVGRRTSSALLPRVVDLQGLHSRERLMGRVWGSCIDGLRVGQHESGPEYVLGWVNGGAVLVCNTIDLGSDELQWGRGVLHLRPGPGHSLSTARPPWTLRAPICGLFPEGGPTTYVLSDLRARSFRGQHKLVYRANTSSSKARRRSRIGLGNSRGAFWPCVCPLLALLGSLGPLPKLRPR